MSDETRLDMGPRHAVTILRDNNPVDDPGIAQAINVLEALIEDRDRLDWLQSQSKVTGVVPDRGWIARDSTEGRGFRLHESSRHNHSPTVREAIDLARGTVRIVHD